MSTQTNTHYTHPTHTYEHTNKHTNTHPTHTYEHTDKHTLYTSNTHI